MLVQETRTDLAPLDVIERAREFFTARFTQYGASEGESSDSHITFLLDAGEVMISATPSEDRTLVRGSSSRIHHEISQFLATLANPEDVQQNIVGPGTSGAG